MKLHRPFVLPILLAVFCGLAGLWSLQLWGQESPNRARSVDLDRPKFNVVSIQPVNGNLPFLGAHFEAGGRFVMTQYPVSVLISLAYGIVVYAGHPTRLIVGAPPWIDSKLYDIEAKAEGDPPREQMKLMLQSLLADRFKLAAHRETRQLPIYALVMNTPGKTGPQMVLHAADNSTCRDPSIQSTPSEPGAPPEQYAPPCGGGQLMSAGHLSGELMMDELAKQISYFQQIDRAVANRTGLSGIFDFQLDYAPFWGVDVGTPASDKSLPSTIFEALQEQLGLKLKPARGPVDVLVIDHIEMPSPN
jgi:bla regulator protein blaR1